MSTPNGSVRARRLPALSGDAIERHLDALVDEFPGPNNRGDPLLVVPDVHHPYHPSTGLVTNPRVVDAAVACLRERGWEPRIAVPDADAARYLGVEAVAAERDASLVGLADVPRTEVVVGDRGSTEVTLPEPIARQPVVVVPTLRRGADGTGDRPAGVASRCVAAASAGRPTDVGDEDALDAVDPVGAVIDATYTAGETPTASEFLLAGTDPVALDAVAADLLGVEPSVEGADPVIADTSIDALRRQVATGSPKRTEPHSVLAAGYRLYARIVGDAIPPQFQPEQTGEPPEEGDGRAD